MRLVISISEGKIEFAYLLNPFEHLIAKTGDDYRKIQFERLVRKSDFERLQRENEGLQTLLDAYKAVSDAQPHKL